ncbi:MAG: hypothetical protein HGA85_05850 [Nanoarchaeota archaeon]|nr:hypothetical protein [Nanoarchaeota archaeon]
MFQELTTGLIEAIRTHGLLAVVAGVLIETVIVPIPSPLILMAAGYILVPHAGLAEIGASILTISIIAGIAQTIGSLLLYLPGYYIGKPFIQKYHKLHGVSWHEIEMFQDKFSKGKSEFFTVFMLRAVPVIPLSFVSGACGIIKMKFREYLLSTFTGVIPRNIVYASAGFLLGEFYVTVAKWFDYGETIFTILIILLVAAYILSKKFGIIEKLKKKVLK